MFLASRPLLRQCPLPGMPLTPLCLARCWESFPYCPFLSHSVIILPGPTAPGTPLPPLPSPSLSTRACQGPPLPLLRVPPGPWPELLCLCTINAPHRLDTEQAPGEDWLWETAGLEIPFLAVAWRVRCLPGKPQFFKCYCTRSDGIVGSLGARESRASSSRRLDLSCPSASAFIEPASATW